MHAFIHDRIFHLGGAEKVFQDLIREKQGEKIIFTLFSDKKTFFVGDEEIPVVIALPQWINDIFVYFSKPFNPEFFHHLEEEVYNKESIATSDNKKIQQAKRIANKGNKILMQIIAITRKYIHKILTKIFDYRNLIVFYPFLTKTLSQKILKKNPKTVTISSFAAVKNIIPPGKIRNIPTTLYLHSPMQYIWENYDEYCKKMSRWQLIIFKPLARNLRKRDSKPRHYDYILTNSAYTKRNALEHYFNKTKGTNFLHFDSNKIHIQYPKLEKEFINTLPSKAPKDYFLYIGRLVKFVRETDLIIKLCNEINIPLLIMGSGPDEKYLKEIAGDTITFIGQVNDKDEKIEIIKNARGIVNLAKESCGIGTMEALSLGVPVFGFKGGATTEFINNINGVLAENKDIEHLILKFQEFLKKESGFEREKIKKNFLEKI